jgi:GDP-L-fucose synthase
LVEELLEAGALVRVVQRSCPAQRLGHCLDRVEFVSADLSNPDQCRRALEGAEMVFSAAALVGGIQYNLAHPGRLFHANACLGLNVLEAARLEGTERFVLTSSTCVYPREAPVPTSEEFGLVGEPEGSNIGYGWAKRMEELAARFYAQEYGMKVAVVRPTNLYGPRDHFEPAVSHVIPALVRRTLEAKNTLEVWGSGAQTRSFLYVKDAARALLAAGEQYATADPVNVGTEEEVTIRELTQLIIEATGRRVAPRFDPTAPEGQPRKVADVSKAKRVLDWQPRYDLRAGLRETVDWYLRWVAALQA